MNEKSQPSNIYKPNYTVFFGYYMIKVFGGFLALLLILGLFGLIISSPELLFLVGIAFLCLLLPAALVSGFIRHIQYRKEEYELTSDVIIARSGSIFSNNEVELSVKNITDVERIHPWLESMIFGTGKIKIESAGSSTTEVLLQSIDKPEELTNQIETILSDYGFDLSTDELIYQTRPSKIGILLDTVGFVISIIMGSVFTGFYALINIEDPEAFDAAASFISSPVILIVLLIALMVIIALAALRAADLRKRVYSIFAGVIRYEEGFLTKHYAIIPTQNLSDANVQQDIFRRIFGISNVVLSTRGTQNQIKFANIPNAAEMENVIDAVIRSQADKTQKLMAQKQEMKVTEFKEMSEEEKQALPESQQRQLSKLATKQSKRKSRSYSDFTGEFKRSLLYLMASPLIGLIVLSVICLIIGLFVMIVTGDIATALGAIITILVPVIGISVIGLFFTYMQNLISYFAVSYQIRENSIYEEFSFLSRNTREFTLDKVTAIKFRRGLFQRMFGVCTINFYSIGSAQNIVMRDIPYSREMVESLLNKLGIKRAVKDIDATYTPQFNIKDWILRSIIPVGLGGLVIIPLIILGISLLIAEASGSFWGITFTALMFIYFVIMTIGIGFHWWYQTTVKLDIFDEHLAFRGGILTLTEHYAALEYVKNTHSVKYPFTNTGSIKFDVAGAHYLQQNPATRAKQQRGQNQFAQFGAVHQQNQASAIGNNNLISISYIPNVFAEHDQTDLYIAEEEGLVSSTKLNDDNRKLLNEEIVSTKPSLVQAGVLLSIASLFTGVGIFLLPISLPIQLWYTSTKTYTLSGLRISFLQGIFYHHKTTIINAQIDHIEKSQNLVNKIFGTGNVQINTEGGQGVEMNIVNVIDHDNFYSKTKQEYN